MMKHWAFRLLRSLALAYALILLLVLIFQRKMIYFPTRGVEADLLKDAESEDLQPWRDAAGQRIGWRRATPNAPRRVVVFHGNAGQAVNRVYYADALGALGWEVLLFEYPGYGSRAGSPGKEPFLATGRAAVDELLAADSRPVYLLGESIGSGTACALAGQLPERIAGLLLVVPFARLAEVGQKALPFLPVRLLLRDNFDNLSALTVYKGSLAVVLAQNDEVIGPAQARTLHAAYAGPKMLCELPDCGHNDFPAHRGAEWWKEASDFLTRTAGEKPAAKP